MLDPAHDGKMMKWHRDHEDAKMRHEWKDEPYGGAMEAMSSYGKRKCTHCGAIQTKCSEQEWGRVVRYRWYPLAGRCKGEKADE